jgi:predicted phage terminase large subunit-like protein
MAVSNGMVELSRTNLMAFVKATMPSYDIGWVHREICGQLMRFFVKVKKKESPRLIITMPPRHGKSQLVSRHFPSWGLGVDPDTSIIAASYSASLAKRFNKNVQNIIESDIYHEIFPNTSFTERSEKVRFVKRRKTYVKTMEFFEVPGFEGSLRSVGVEGGITGMGADILIIDDPFKDRKSADSPTVRESVWDWYTSTAYTRLSPCGGVLVTVTRWHEDDLVGRLVEAMKQEGGDQWEIINYPAIAERDEPHRKKGEALHPGRYPLEMLLRIKHNIGSYDWGSLYQQHPTPRGGGVFKAKWIRHWTECPKVFDRVIQSWDFTFKDSENSDNVSGQVWGQLGSNFYLLDNDTDRMDFVSQVRAMQRMSSKWPEALEKVVEDKANGPAIISAIGSRIPGIVPYTPRGSKTARAYSVSPLFEAGNVYLPPMDEEHPWVKKYVDELLAFPNAEHDDQVDSTTQALDTLVTHEGGGVLDFV